MTQTMDRRLLAGVVTCFFLSLTAYRPLPTAY